MKLFITICRTALVFINGLALWSPLVPWRWEPSQARSFKIIDKSLLPIVRNPIFAFLFKAGKHTGTSNWRVMT